MYKTHDLLQIHHEGASLGCGSAIDHAIIDENRVLFTTRLHDFSYLQCLDLPLAKDMDIDITAPCTMCQVAHDVTSIAAGQIGEDLHAIIASGNNSGPITLTFQSITGSLAKQVILATKYESQHKSLDAIVSMSLLSTKDEIDVVLLLCGTRNGLVVVFEIDKATFVLVASHTTVIGATPVRISRDEFTKSTSRFFAICDSKAYILIPKTSQLQGLVSGRHVQGVDVKQIWLSDALKPELQQPKITSVAGMRPLAGGTSGSLLVISGSQLLITGLSTHTKPVTRQLAIGGTPNRLMYSHTLGLLVVAASVNGKSSILFIDPDFGENVSKPWNEATQTPVDFISGLGNSDEKIFRLFEWSYLKDGKTWKFVIASTSTGRLTIISIHDEPQTHKDTPPNHTSNQRRIRFYTRYKFKYNEPVYSATGLPGGLLWGAGRKLLYDVLDADNKKFRRVAEFDLPSPAINLSYEDGAIYALTSCHSLEILKLVTDTVGGVRFERTHGDQVARDALHHLAVAIPSQRPIHLVSDKLSSVVGLWPTYNTKADTLESVFEAALPSSILRFRITQCRPVWDPVRNQRQSSVRTTIETRSLPNLMGNCEALGLSISGSFIHFAILDFKTWRFLRLVMDLCIRSPEICEFTYKDDPVPADTATEPKIMMHVDGDILRKCVSYRALERLLLPKTETGESVRIWKRFVALLQDVHCGTLEKDATPLAYIDQAYADMEYYLRPVL